MPLTDFSRRKLKDSLTRQAGNNDYIRDYLTLNSWDVAAWEDDFIGDLMRGGTTGPGAYQSDAVGAASEALTLVAPSAASRSGAVTLKSGTADDGYAGASLGLNWYGENMAMMVAIVKVSAITNFKMEVGFTDVVSGTDAGACNVLGTASTTTWNASDAAIWIVDSDLTASWRHVGVAAGTTSVLGVPGTSPMPGFGNYDADQAPNADTYELMGVELKGTTARFFRGHMVSASAGTDLAGRLTVTYDSGWLYRTADSTSDYITSTVALTPWLFVQTRNAGATSRTLTTDFLGVYQSRYNAD